MARKSKLISVAALASMAVLTVALLFTVGPFRGGAQTAQAQAPPTSTMEQRLGQITKALTEAKSPGAEAAALDMTLEILQGGAWPVPSKGMLDETQRGSRAYMDMASRLAQTLGKYAMGKPDRGEDAALRGQALNLKLLVEQTIEVTQAVGQVGAKCGEGDLIGTAPVADPRGANNPCNDLMPLLDEATGQEMAAGLGAGGTPIVIRPGLVIKLRSPAIPHPFTRWQEDVRVTEPIGTGECAVVFKESRGLMLRLVFDRIIVVSDPWVTFYGVPRGTIIPIWRLEFMPAEYVKEWNICNVGGAIKKTVTQRVVQDVPLKYFWRFYPKDP